MRWSAGLALVLALAACGPPQGPPASKAPPARDACNDVAINPARRAETLAAAAASVETLLGGPIPPGHYDLVSMDPRDGAAAPLGDLWETVRVRDTEDGIMLDFAIVRGAPTNTAQRVNARLAEGAEPQLVHVCGATGAVPVSYAAQGEALQLLLPAEGGAGKILYTFVRRAD